MLERRFHAVACITLALGWAGCSRLRIPESPARLALVASQTSRATWAFEVEVHAQEPYFFFDGRQRTDACQRRGTRYECELHGLWPGGHSFEFRLPGAVLRRSAVVGEWPDRPLVARVADEDEVKRAADAFADGVFIEPRVGDPRDLALAAHARGLRVLTSSAEWIAGAGADGVLGAGIPAAVTKKFPSARAFEIADPGLIDARGRAGGARALAAPRGAIVDAAALEIIAGVRHDKRFRRSLFTAREDAGALKVESVRPPGATITVAGEQVSIDIDPSAPDPKGPVRY